ncbi:MAG: ribosomal RNA small subunit methyltransferase A, partial [Bdellovibrio sp. CG10_big_fil_rev_8_21_14_0_10_47_8]
MESITAWIWRLLRIPGQQISQRLPMSKTWERLQKTLQEHGLEPKKSLGQNFLVNDQTIEKIVGAAKETAAEWLLEIGPGPGALTEGLRHLAPHFQVIELDRNWAQHWRDQGLKVIEADALQIQWSELLNEAPSTGIKSLVSNLPYQISSSLVIDRCLDEKPFDFMILMFQKEVAQRIRARLEDPLYGMLSVVAQSFWKIETLLDAGARDFFPPPKVASRVLIFRKLDSPVADRRRYLR